MIEGFKFEFLQWFVLWKIPLDLNDTLPPLKISDMISVNQYPTHLSSLLLKESGV